MSATVISFNDRTCTNDGQVVKPALKPVGLAPLQGIEIVLGEVEIEHPERLLIIALSDKPTAPEIESLWRFIARWRSHRC
jgi:hypothetical protein